MSNTDKQGMFVVYVCCIRIIWNIAKFVTLPSSLYLAILCDLFMGGFKGYLASPSWLVLNSTWHMAIPTGSRPNEETSIRAASLANVTRAWQSTLALLAAGQRQHSEVSEVELYKKNFKKISFHRPLLLARYHWQQNRMKWDFYTWQFFLIFLISRLCKYQGTSITIH